MPDFGRIPASHGLNRVGCVACGSALDRRRDGRFRHPEGADCEQVRAGRAAAGGPLLWYMPDDDYQEYARNLGWGA